MAFLNALIEFYQLQKSEAILASFLAMIPPSCRVVRDGTLITVPAADLVKGDIVLVVSHRSLPYCVYATLIMTASALWRQDPSRLDSVRCFRPQGGQ